MSFCWVCHDTAPIIRLGQLRVEWIGYKVSKKKGSTLFMWGKSIEDVKSELQLFLWGPCCMFVHCTSHSVLHTDLLVGKCRLKDFKPIFGMDLPRVTDLVSQV